jgi:hypothetical protein
LVKIGVKLEKAMEDFIDQSHDMDGNDDADLDIDISLPDSDENE